MINIASSRPTLVFTGAREPLLDPFQLFVNVGTWSPASHAAIGLGDWLLHVHDAGVVHEPRSAWLDSGQRLIAEYAVLPDVRAGLVERFSHLGDRYAFFEVAKITALRLMHLLAFPVRSLGPVARGSHTCAEFVMGLDPSGLIVPEWRSINRASVVPADLLAAMGPSFRRIA